MAGAKLLRWCVDESVPAAGLAGVHAGLVAEAVRSGCAWLRVYTVPGDAISLGRFHPVAPSLQTGGPVEVVGRLTGGRIVPLGAGYLGVALALPHRAALVGDDPGALAPEQALNRCVRGVMGACDAIGFGTYYPGRDLLTHQGRPFAIVTLTVEPDGGTLFEAVVSVERDLAQLPFLLDRVDPEGTLRATFWTPADVTSVAAGATRVPPAAELAHGIAAAYAKTFGMTLESASSSAAPPAPASPRRSVPPHLDRRHSASIMLGVLEVHARIVDGRFDEVFLTGDLIAPIATVCAIESALRGVAATTPAVTQVLTDVLAEPAHFLLGAGPTADLAAAIAAVGR